MTRSGWGPARWAPSPRWSCYNVLITAQGEGIITDGRFTLNRVYEMGANAARLFYTKYASFTGVVTDVWQGKAE